MRCLKRNRIVVVHAMQPHLIQRRFALQTRNQIAECLRAYRPTYRTKSAPGKATVDKNRVAQHKKVAAEQAEGRSLLLYVARGAAVCLLRNQAYTEALTAGHVEETPVATRARGKGV